MKTETERNKQTDSPTDRDRQTYKQTQREIDGRTGKQTDRQTVIIRLKELQKEILESKSIHKLQLLFAAVCKTDHKGKEGQDPHTLLHSTHARGQPVWIPGKFR